MEGYNNYGSFASDAEILAAAKAQAGQQSGKPAGTKKRKEDTRFWKPFIQQDNPVIYQAQVRPLPRDPQGKLSFSVRQDTHFIKENGVFLTVKCRKTFGDKEHCPICEANWAMYNTKQKPLMDRAYGRRNQTKHIANFLILTDLNRPEYNGTVKLWEHTNTVNEFLSRPMGAGVEIPLPPDAPFGAVPQREHFVPYNPQTGKNMRVKLELDPKTEIPTYDNSTWDQHTSAFANNAETYNHIMSQVNDLTEFLNDVPSVEDLIAKYADFNDRLSRAGQDPGAQRGFVPGGFGGVQPGFAQGGFGVPQGVQPTPGSFAPPGQPAFPNAYTQPQAPINVNHNTQHQASIQTPIPGWNTTGFQNPTPPPVINGNANTFFNGATPSAGMNFNNSQQQMQQSSPGDDLPF